MKTKSWFVLLYAGVALTADAASLADRLYVNADIGIAQRELDSTALGEQPQAYPGSGVSFRDGSGENEAYGALALGIRFTEYFALEAGYQGFGSTDVRIQPPPNVIFIIAPPEDYRFREHAFTLDPVFSVAVHPRVKLHAFWGVAFNHSKVSVQNYVFGSPATKSSRSTLSRLGAGATIELRKQLDLRVGVDYQKFASFTREGWLVHAGIRYRF